MIQSANMTITDIDNPRDLDLSKYKCNGVRFSHHKDYTLNEEYVITNDPSDMEKTGVGFYSYPTSSLAKIYLDDLYRAQFINASHTYHV